MSTPIETAAHALIPYSGAMTNRPLQASVALASLAQHRDDIARVLANHVIGGVLGAITCDCDRWPYDESDDQTFEGHARHQADAVLAYLTGETS